VDARIYDHLFFSRKGRALQHQQNINLKIGNSPYSVHIDEFPSMPIFYR
jgi:hypothetical protein